MNRARNTMPGGNGNTNGTTNGNNRMNGNTGGDMNRNMNGNTGGNMNGGMNGSNGGNNRMNGNMNGGMNGNINNRNMNGRDTNGGALRGTLAEQIRALGFVKAELELYLDTHPGCRTALDYYHQTLRELKRLVEEYENTVGPLRAEGVTNTENWTWIDGPWPWQMAGDFMREGDR